MPESSRQLFSGRELSLCMLPVLCCVRRSIASAEDNRCSLEQLTTFRVLPLYTRYSEYASPGSGGGGGGGSIVLEAGRSDSERVEASAEDLCEELGVSCDEHLVNSNVELVWFSHGCLTASSGVSRLFASQL